MLNNEIARIKLLQCVEAAILLALEQNSAILWNIEKIHRLEIGLCQQYFRWNEIGNF